MSADEAQTTANIITGTVKWFNVKHGYGFITKEGSEEDIFVHQTAIIKNNPKKYLRSVGDGETVEFIIIQGTKGPEAAQVTGPNGTPVQGSKYAPDRRSGGQRGRFRGGSGSGRRNPRRTGPRPTYQDSQGEDKNDNSEAEAETEAVDRRRPRNPRRRPRRPRGPKDDSQTQEDGQKEDGPKDDSASAQPPPPRRRNYRPRRPRSNDDGQEVQQGDGDEATGGSPRRRTYNRGGGNYRSRTFHPRPQQQDGEGDDGAEQPRPPRRRRNRGPRRPRQNEEGEGGANQENQDPPPQEENNQQKD